MTKTAADMARGMFSSSEAVSNLTSTKTLHTLIAGTTGSGKSVLLNACILELIQNDTDCYFFDLKRVELKEYRNSMACKGYITEPADICPALDEIVMEMDRRFANMDGKETDAKHIYIIIDELADTLTQKGVLERLVKIGRLGRAAHIHLFCATQDPSRMSLPAQLAQNFTCTVALRCRSDVESRQVIGVSGAEDLPQYGYGYMWDYRGINKIEVTPVTAEEKAQIIAENQKPVQRSILRQKPVQKVEEAPVYTEYSLWQLIKDATSNRFFKVVVVAVLACIIFG